MSKIRYNAASWAVGNPTARRLESGGASIEERLSSKATMRAGGARLERTAVREGAGETSGNQGPETRDHGFRSGKK